jgi:hypothetical protein
MAGGNTIWLDANAAGWGWLVDPTSSWGDSEFATPGNQGGQHRIELFSVLMHEVRHLLAFGHAEDSLMQETLAVDSRLPIGEGGDPDMLQLAADTVFALLAAEEELPWIGSRLFGSKRAKRSNQPRVGGREPPGLDRLRRLT